jgi:hypothetical protein
MSSFAIAEMPSMMAIAPPKTINVAAKMTPPVTMTRGRRVELVMELMTDHSFRNRDLPDRPKA